MPASREQLFALLQSLEQLPPPTRDLDAARAKALGIGRGADEVFEHCVELLMALAEQPKPNFDAVKSVMQVIADVTQDPQLGMGALFGKPRRPAPPAPPQKPAPGTLAPVRPPPVVVSKKSKTMPRVLSYGGGLDSFAILVRSIEINDKPDTAIFIDVAGGTEKQDSPVPGEWPGTYKHIREVVIPMCKKAGIEFIWLGPQIPLRHGGADEARSLIEFYEEGDRPRIPMSGDSRDCTIVAKVERFEDWMKQRWPKGEPVEVWIGFEAGEERRVKKDPNIGKSTQRRNRFPLVEWGWCRCRAEQYVRSKKLPVPRKSACVFCPYGNLSEWQTFARELPEQFKRIVRLEARKLKVPTEAGLKLSLKGYTKLGKWKGKGAPPLPAEPIEGVHYRAPALPVYIKGRPQPKIEKCEVCGAYPKATKQVGCGYLP